MTPTRWNRIEDIYHAASARDFTESREAFLAEACGSDFELRREVESLLEQDESEGILDRPAVSLPDDTPRLGPGSSIGPYRIEESVGKGGMGEVWRARDTRLNREVAIKISARQFTDRFGREARAIAALNHSNICTLHDVGPNYLVMEFVEGVTLAERIRRGPVPLSEGLAISRQIADALEAAHARGIVHRDLKPANIKIRPDGSVKVLDFGLAKASGGEPGLTAESPTVSGMILGTPGYMAPEQARGEAVDKRADIWSFGVVLYEIVTGRKLFEGKSVSDTLAAVLTHEPEWERVPERVRPLLRRCLERDPTHRLRDMSGVELLLEEVPRPAGRGASNAWLLASAFLAVLVTVTSVIHFRERPVNAPVTRFAFTPSGNAEFALTSGSLYPIAVSPDGRRVVFSALSEGKARLWVRSLDELSAKPLPGTEGAVSPFWSPDSRYIGFGADRKLKKIDVNGGSPITLADAVNVNGGTWNSDDVIVFAPNAGGSLLQISATGGAVVPVTTMRSGEPGKQSHRWPWFLPDGRHFLFAVVSLFRSGSDDPVTIRLGSLGSNETHDVMQADSNAIYAEGRLLFLRDSTLMAQAFDLKRMTLNPDAVPVVEGVQGLVPSGAGIFSASRNGTLAYSAGKEVMQLTWFDRRGNPLSVVGDPGVLGELVISADRTKATVLVTERRNSDVWIYDLLRNRRSRFTFNPALELDGVWSPEGATIVFNSARKGQLDLYRKASDGSGPEQLLYADSKNKYPVSWSPDGRLLLYTAADPDTGLDVWVLPIAADGTASTPYPWLRTGFTETNAYFSPDGRWIAYQGNESGRLEIYVSPFSDPARKRQVSTAGGVYPRWRPDGKEIFYVADPYLGHTARQLMAAEVSVKGGEMTVGDPRPLFGPMVTGQGPLYDVSADGQRILAVVPSEQNTRHELTVVRNWAAELKK